MSNTRWVSTLFAAGLSAAWLSTGIAWAGGPDGTVENSDEHSFVAVGTGAFRDSLVGFRGTGNTREEAAAAVIAACQDAGGIDCTSDEETNDHLCIVSVADDAGDVVAGGAGITVEAARQDALQRAAAHNNPMSPTSPVVISDCP